MIARCTHLSLRRPFLGSIRSGILCAAIPLSKNSARKSSRELLRFLRRTKTLALCGGCNLAQANATFRPTNFDVSDLRRRTRGNTQWRTRPHVLFVARRDRQGRRSSARSTPNAFGGSTRFGVYEIDRHADGSLCELGRGAMGVTYRATDTSLQRKVALKIIKIDIAARNADARERFMREARAAAALRHENIARIDQFGMRLETGQYFYAMELIDGETLEERVDRAVPLDARTTMKIAQQVTSALAAAEKCGLVHRDLKPANLMLVSREGETALSALHPARRQSAVATMSRSLL